MHCTSDFSLLHVCARITTMNAALISRARALGSQMSRVFSKRLSLSSALRPPSQRLKKAETRVGTKAKTSFWPPDKAIDKRRRFDQVRATSRFKSILISPIALRRRESARAASLRTKPKKANPAINRLARRGADLEGRAGVAEDWHPREITGDILTQTRRAPPRRETRNRKPSAHISTLAPRRP